MNAELRDAAAKAMQDVIKERAGFGIGIGVIREALDTAFPEYVDVERTLGTRFTNPTPVIETANGDLAWHDVPGGAEEAVTINPAHHTTRRISELNDVVAALNESNNNLLENQGIHEAAITDLKNRMDVLTFRVTGTNSLEERVARIEAGHNLYTPITPPQPTQFGPLTVKKDAAVPDGVALFKDEATGKIVGAMTNIGTTPPAAPDKDAKYAALTEVAFLYEGTKDGTDAECGRLIFAKAVELGLVPTPKIEVTQDDVNRAWSFWDKDGNTMRNVLQDFASRKNGGA